ncbi:MAG: ArnT family glycosyltransferase [Thermogutta sp.]
MEHRDRAQFVNITPFKRDVATFLLEITFWAFALGISFFGLTVLPIVGEEPRRAEVAREMIRSGDWLVPRQQGEFYCTRPPLQNWIIALSALISGGFSPFVVRFPSALATCVTAGICFYFAKRHLNLSTGITAGVAYLTMGLPLTFGQLGETDSLFTVVLASSLLLFYSGYTISAKRRALWWLAGFLCGLAALTKGVQGPVFYLACTLAFLAILRQWHVIFSWEYFGSIAFLCIPVMLWSVPYYLVSGWQHTREIWFGQVEERLVTDGLFKHLLSYPLATFVAMLPWSLSFFSYRKLSLQGQPEIRQLVVYLVVCLVVTFISLWVVPDAKPRYFLPLYPLAAILSAIPFGIPAETKSPACPPVWLGSIRMFFILTVGISLVLLVSLPLGWFVPASSIVSQVIPSPWASVTVLLISVGAAAVLRSACYKPDPLRLVAAVICFGLVLGLGHRLILLRIQEKRSFSPEAAINSVAATLPKPEQLISLDEIPARFRYFYPHFIPVVPQEKADQVLCSERSDFCIHGEWFRKQTDEFKRREVSPDFEKLSFRDGVVFCAKLGFEWQTIAIVPLGRTLSRDPQPVVIVGRRIDSKGPQSAESPVGTVDHTDHS